MRKTIRKAAAAFAAAAAIFCATVPAAAVELKTGIGIVEAGGLRLRAQASTDSDILANAGYGDNVVIIRESGDFYLVDYNLQIGYMSKDYITFKERENVELGYGRVIESSVHLREKPDTASASLTQLAYDEKAYIIGFNCGWYKVEYSGLTGYIRSDLLELTEKPIANSGGTYAETVSVADQLVCVAKSYLGYAYVWGGTSPSTGFDCSGFTKYVFAQLGYSLNRTAAQQLGDGTPVSELKVGDLVFFNNTYSTSAAASHVGIYIGDNQFIHAADGGVKITDLSNPFYASRYVGARRVL